MASSTAKDIEQLRNSYRIIATRGAILFFVLYEMSAINPMYQYSLASYLEVFAYSLRKALPDAVLKKRIRNIINTLSKSVYDYGCTGKIIFSLYIFYNNVTILDTYVCY